MELQERIDALGDIAILVDKYFQDNPEKLHAGDSWNPAGFSIDNIETDFGWIMQELAKPTIDDLEALKASLEE